MKSLRRHLKTLSLALAALAAACLGALIAANWRDDPLSPAAEQALRYTPPAEHALEGNGYLILMGLDAPTGGAAADAAMALGRQRLAREIERRRWVEAHGDAADGMPPSIPVRNDGDEVFPPRLRCPADEVDCLGWYGRHQAEILALVQENQILLQRLSAAADARQFSNPAPLYLLTEFPPFARLVHAHELWLAQAALHWSHGQRRQAMDIARQAARLRSRLASSSNSLIASMIALAMQYRELRWLSDTSATLEPQAPAAADIEALLAIPPPSLGSALEGEKQFAAGVFHSLKEGSGLPASPWDAPPAWWQRLLDRASTWAFLPQQTLNMSLARIEEVQAISGLPAHQLEAAFSSALRQWAENDACGAPWKRLRNAMGLCLAAIAAPSYQGYVQRVADIDGYRRLVMLQHRAIVQRLALADMPAWLQATPAELRNPYSLRPMRWDAATGSLLFEGREKQIRNPDQSPIYRIRLGG